MKLFTLMRVFAQLIDLIVGMLIFAGSFLVVPLFVSQFIGNEMIVAILALAAAIIACFLLQLPFMQNSQTLGKAFCGMTIISTDDRYPVTVGLMFHREIVMKLATCYLICVPMLAGQPGGHEEATHTAVVKLPRKSKSI